MGSLSACISIFHVSRSIPSGRICIAPIFWDPSDVEDLVVDHPVGRKNIKIGLTKGILLQRKINGNLMDYSELSEGSLPLTTFVVRK